MSMRACHPRTCHGAASAAAEAEAGWFLRSEHYNFKGLCRDEASLFQSLDRGDATNHACKWRGGWVGG